MALTDAERWNFRYRDPKAKGFTEPAALLVEHSARFLTRGLALDLAMGLGGNAGFLMSQGLTVIGVDISEVAARAARARLPALNAVVADLECFDLPAGCLDVIVMFRYTQRSLWPRFRRWLRPGGWVVIESFGEARRAAMPNADPSYFLRSGELRAAFGDWRIAACYDAHSARPDCAGIVAQLVDH